MVHIRKLNLQNIILHKLIKDIRASFHFSMNYNGNVDNTVSFFQCLCISPTYELALQTGKVIAQMGKFYPEVKLAYAVRGHKSK